MVNSSIAVFIFDERPLSFMPKFVGLPNQINFIDHEKFIHLAIEVQWLKCIDRFPGPGSLVVGLVVHRTKFQYQR